MSIRLSVLKYIWLFTLALQNYGDNRLTIARLISNRDNRKTYIKQPTELNTGQKVSMFGVFWSIFSQISTEYGPEKFRIQTLFTQ